MGFRARVSSILFTWSFLSGPLVAQQPVRVQWPLVDFIILSDTSRVTLLASPNLSTMVGSEGSNLAHLTFDPVQVRQWTGFMRRVVDSMARVKRLTQVGVVRPYLVTTSERAYIAVGAGSGSRDERFILVLNDSVGLHSWISGASVSQVDTILSALGSAAERRPELGDAGPTDSCTGKTAVDSIPLADSGGLRVAEQLPQLISHNPLVYPFNEQRIEREGRVWLQFIVDREGRPEPSSFCVLLTDGTGFTASALQWFRAARYVPAKLLDRPVRWLVFQEVRFIMPLHEDR
jgi:hypothetical protein